MRYSLNLEKRKQIELMLKEGRTQQHIAQTLNIGVKFLRQEIKKCGEREDYTAEKAETESDHFYIARAYDKKMKRTQLGVNTIFDLISHQNKIMRKLEEIEKKLNKLELCYGKDKELQII